MKGYSLLELSIVVVIMGLLMAGATTGIKILRKAELQSSISQLKELEAAIISFKEQYYAYPGDIRGIGGFKGGDKNNTNNYSNNCMRDRNYNVTYKKDKPCVIALRI